MKNTLILFLTILFGLTANVSAQNNRDYEVLLGDLTEVITLCSQAQGDAQQVATFAANGNLNQLRSELEQLNFKIGQITRITGTMMNNSIPDRITYFELARSVSLWETSRSAWDAGQSGRPEEIEAAAIELRAALDRHKGTANEIRIAICCRMD